MVDRLTTDPQGSARNTTQHTTMNAQIIRKTTTILELPAGWLAKERGTTYKTAHAALQATRREDRAITRDLPSSAVVRIVNWELTTNAGRAVVLALNPQSESFGLTTPRNQ